MALPNGYTRVEYIQSSGTQYIDTVFMPNQNTRVVMDAQITTIGTKGQFFFGARGASYKPAFAFMYSTDGPSFKYAYNATTTKGVSTNFTARLYVDANKNICSFNGESITITAGTYQSAISMYLFASNENGTTNWYAAMRLYSCKVYDNGTLVRDFVPCKNASGAVGLYDVVNGAFYENKGSGTFTAGAELIPEYKIVDATMLDTALSATADAIRVKAGNGNDVAWNESAGFAGAVLAIVGGSSVKLQSKTATPSSASQTIKPDSGYDGLSQVTVGAIPSTFKRVATGTFTAAYDGAPSVSVTGIGFKPTGVVVYVAGSFTDEQIENDNVIHVPLCATYNIELPNGTRVHYVSRENFESDDGEQWDMPTVNPNDNWWNINPTDDGFTITHDSMYNGMRDITYGYVAIG